MSKRMVTQPKESITMTGQRLPVNEEVGESIGIMGNLDSQTQTNRATSKVKRVSHMDESRKVAGGSRVRFNF